MSDVHVKYLLARIELSVSAITVRGEEGPSHAPRAENTSRIDGTCQHCGGRRFMPYHTDECRYEYCAVRAIEMRKAKR